VLVAQTLCTKRAHMKTIMGSPDAPSGWWTQYGIELDAVHSNWASATAARVDAKSTVESMLKGCVVGDCQSPGSKGVCVRLSQTGKRKGKRVGGVGKKSLFSRRTQNGHCRGH
jgi:hypothetical protein